MDDYHEKEKWAFMSQPTFSDKNFERFTDFQNKAFKIPILMTPGKNT